MRDIRIAAAQFEHRNNDKAYNLARIRALASRAVDQGAEMVSFHECSVPAYTFLRSLSKEELLDIAEAVPDGPGTQGLMAVSKEMGVPILAGLLEREEGRVYNSYVAVRGREILARFRKLHPFINPHLSAGSEYCVFDYDGVRCGLLVCYDNNLPENVRATTLLGAEVIFMPHVTGCLPSPMPGRGLVDPALWERREQDPVPLRQEFLGPKGRGWLLRWLPARAYENGVYAVFTNPVGMDDDQVRNGNAMILDPFGEILAESRALGDDVVVALCTAGKIPLSSGRRYLRARRPELYAKLVEPPPEPPATCSGWLEREGSGAPSQGPR
jgi:predicted amidohydrolase